MYTLLMLIHLIGVAAWLGANLLQIFLLPQFERQGSAVAAAWHQSVTRLGAVYYMVAGAAVTVSGIAMVLRGQAEWSSGFVSLGFAAVIIGGLAGAFFFGPRGRAAAAAHASGDATSAGRLTSSIRFGAIGDTVIVVVTMAAMISRWAA